MACLTLLPAALPATASAAEHFPTVSNCNTLFSDAPAHRMCRVDESRTQSIQNVCKFYAVCMNNRREWVNSVVIVPHPHGVTALSNCNGRLRMGSC